MAARSIALATDKQLTYRLQNSGIPPQTEHEGKKKVATFLSAIRDLPKAGRLKEAVSK